MAVSQSVPPHLKLVYSAEVIANRVKVLGESISIWTNEVWRVSHTDVLAIPVLRGGIFFFADLVRHIKDSVEIAPARTWMYEDVADPQEGKPSQRTTLGMDLSAVPAKGRAILVIDDICDSGKSLAGLTEGLRKEGAREVRTAVLVTRKIPEQEYVPDWSGFDYPGKEWLVGYGMDDSQRWRNLAGVYLITQR